MSSIYQTYTPPSPNGGFLKIEDGKTVVLRIASEPVIFNSEYKGNPSTRYAWVVYNMTEECAQVFSQSATFFRNLAVFANDDEYGDPTTYNIKVTRNGTETNTTYTIVASPKKSLLTTAQKEAVDEIDIIKAIQSGPGVTNVFWLAEVAETEPRSEQSGYEKAKAVAQQISGKDEVITDFDENEKVDLSDIPF